jgi:hypothetical protein
MTYPTCPRCGATITNKGVSHSGRPGGQWECRCGYIKDDDHMDQYGCDDRGKQQQSHPSAAPDGW